MPRLEAWSRANAVAMLGACATVMSLGRSWPLGAAALLSFGILLVRHRGAWATDRRTIVPNAVTAARLVILLLFAVFLRGGPGVLWAAAAVGVLALDSLDGWLARRANATTAFGAHFDMETDALFVLVLELELWMRGQLGAWIVTTGLLRYLFVLLVVLVPPR
jgi:phosphatidylglycerophosphate synthase